MLLFFIKLYFFATCLAISLLHATTDPALESYDGSDWYDPSMEMNNQAPADENTQIDVPAPPDPTQATPIAETPAPATAAAADTSVPNTQLKWPDTIELQETATNIVPADAAALVNTTFDKTQKSITEMDTAVKEMVQKRASLYSDFFTQCAAADDFMQDQQVTIGSLIELFNPADIKD